MPGDVLINSWLLEIRKHQWTLALSLELAFIPLLNITCLSVPCLGSSQLCQGLVNLFRAVYLFIYFEHHRRNFTWQFGSFDIGLYFAVNRMPTYEVSYTVLQYNHPYDIISLKAHIGVVFNFQNLIGFNLRLKGIFKTISYYFLQNVWNCSLFLSICI